MKKNVFNSLEENQQTFDKLNEIIKTSEDFDEVFFALLKQSEVLFAYEEYEKASKILIKLFNENNRLDEKHLNILIESLIKIESKSLALYYINIKKESLPQMEMYKYLLDLLKYKKHFNEDFYYLFDSLRVYNFDKKVLIPYYIMRLKEYVDSNSDLTEIAYKEINNFYLEKNDREIVEELYFDYLLNNKIPFEEFLENKKGLNKVYFELRLLMRSEMLKRVQIIEVENENEFDSLSLFRQDILFKELKDFYNKNNDFKSFDLYNKKHKKTLEDIKNLKRKPKKKKLHFKVEEEISVEEIIPKKEKTKQPLTSKKLYLLENFVSDLSKLDLSISLFDRLRNIGILLEKYFEFSDIIFYNRPQLYHYKKERLYSKKHSVATIESSIPGLTAKTLDDFVSDVEFAVPDYDLIADKPLTETDVRQVYSYGMEEGFSITFYQSKRKGLHFDDLAFKTISRVIYYDIKYDKHLSVIEKRFNIISDLFNSKYLKAFVYKDEFLGTPLFNELFRLNKNDNLSNLVLKFDPELRIKYNNLLNNLRKEEITSFEIDLHYKNKNYLVKHFINNGYIYGLFIEVTDKVLELESWQEKASYDPISNLLTLHEFEVAFNGYINRKTTFVLIELDNLNKIEFLYGKALKRNFFLEFIDYSKEHFEQVYLYDQSSIIAVLNVNDIRTVENKLSKFKYNVELLKSKILKEQRFISYMGIIRYPVNTKEKNIERIYQYLSLSLYKAKTIEKNKGYSYFDFKDYELDLFETEIIKQIDNLILTESLLLNYTQIVNYKNKNVYAYEVGVTSNTLNVYEEYYYQVAKKRDMLKRLEKYVLRKSFLSLKNIYEETSSYVKLVVNISSETLNSPNFTSFLTSLYRTYKIPYEAIEIKANVNKYKLEVETKLKELSNFNIVIGTENLEYIYKDYIKVFHLTKKVDLRNEKTLNYLRSLNDYLKNESMLLIVYNVNTDEEVKVLNELGINYIRGKMVDRKLSYNELISVLKK